MMWLVATAFGADMEGLRLAGELESYLQENKWGGVEKAYVKLVRNHPQTLAPAHHLAGAEAAKNRGELMLAAQRLSRIPEGAAEFTQAQADLDLFEHQTRLVIIDQPGKLDSTVLPFNPSLRAAMDFAKAELERAQYFVGLLPSGEYSLDGVPFQVTQGFQFSVVHVERPEGAPPPTEAVEETPAAPEAPAEAPAEPEAPEMPAP
ncbi:MAG: hypothetical protein H6737_07385 [Alphaproteobacteria bacterium]|nr:hypothetical protein [Alphaproteobacteria bacterium]